MPSEDRDIEVVEGNIKAKVITDEYNVIVCMLSGLASKKTSDNMFNNLPSLAKSKLKQAHDELDAYLAADIVNVTDVLVWWSKQHKSYPLLSQMAIDYLSIPGKSLQHSEPSV